jgi:hypothetical protein
LEFGANPPGSSPSRHSRGDLPKRSLQIKSGTTADELKAGQLTWVAGVHRNTDHPHVHLLINRTYSDRETGHERRLTRIPEEMLASRISDENGVEKINPGSFGRAFENVLDRTQERARGTNQEHEDAARNATAARIAEALRTEEERTAAADSRPHLCAHTARKP